MLSVENPPPDPSCSSKSQQLNSNSDEKASTKDINHHPNFSIRGYVFTVRRKDVKKNWPFSSKNLQLCLKNGVKELLPPLETVSRQSTKRRVVETSSLQKEKTGNRAVRDLSSNNPQLNYKLVESCFDISPCRSVDDNDFPSTTTTTTASHSEIESLKLSTSLTEPLSKKCRLTVKFGGNSDRSSTEDIASASTVSKIMASNVCPVCKTFSSSSNTTLNAHIDQCLSVESTPRWTSDSKLKRQRIKLRKTRLMVDIYSTALPCTLEELDRRNGTTWAAVSCLPMQEIEKTDNGGTVNERKRMRESQSHPEDNGDVGPVYVDSNGRKVRILFKSDDLPSLSKVTGDNEARKPPKGDKGVKYISKTKKKKRLAQKHHEFQKLAPQSKMNFSLNTHSSQIVEEECEGEAKRRGEENVVLNQTKQSDSMTLKAWVCSKRRGFTKKTSQEGRQPVTSNWKLPRNLLAFDGQEEREEIADESVEINALHVSERVEELAIRTSQPDHCFQSTEDYERLLFGTESEASPAPNELHFDCGPDMFCADEPDHRQSFPEFDPILIPGPPGSFLPSPRDMGSEDFQGNSSLTTSRVHFDSSGSPRSASSVGPSAEPNCAQVEKDGFYRICEDKGSLGFENERLSRAVALNLQDSQLLRRRTMASMAFSNPTSGCTVSLSDSSGSGPAPNLVLRLMGKNLQVLNKDDGPV